MKIKFIYIILFLFHSQSHFSQNKSVAFSNTYWKVISHYVNSDTWTLEPLSKKPSIDADFSYLEFDNKNHFKVNLNYGCREIAFGDYKIEKSHIYFNTKTNKIEPSCQSENDDFWPKKMAFNKKRRCYILRSQLIGMMMKF